MTKKNFLIRKLEGQIGHWDEGVNKLRCEIDETSLEKVKSECQNKISELQLKIAKAEDEILELKKIPPTIR